MSATLGALLADPELGLRLLTDPGPDAEVLRRPVRWVATSELDDPTPYLRGGELLLTTGLRLPRGRAAVDGYVARLLDAGVVALGYGVGIATDQVPAALVRATGDRGLPLVEVDRPTPFTAVSKAVADLLTAHRFAEVNRGFTGQRALTRAAVTARAPGVVDRLAATVGGWAALLDPSGAVRHAAPASARPSAEAVTGELDRLRGRRPAALSLVQGASHVVVHPLAPTPRGRGFLVVGADHPLDRTDQSLVNVATALLSFDLERAGVAENAARSAALLRLVIDGPHPDEALLVGLGGALLTGSPLHATVCAGPADALGVLADDLVAALGDRVLAGIVDDALVAVTATAQAQALLLRTVPGDGTVATGTSTGEGWRRLAGTVGQARGAAAAARHLTPPVLDHARLAGTSAVGLVDPPALAAYTEAVLGPLDSYARDTGIDLVASLAAWLGQHGQYDPAAAALGVHRHTLRYRVRKAATLLGRDLSSADARMELWFAITARQRRLSTPAH